MNKRRETISEMQRRHDRELNQAFNMFCLLVIVSTIGFIASLIALFVRSLL